MKLGLLETALSPTGHVHDISGESNPAGGGDVQP